MNTHAARVRLRMLRLGLGMVLAAGFGLTHPPARLLDALLAQASTGGLRLVQAEGSLWRGRGVLASRSADGRSIVPWLALAWRLDGAALADGALQWSVEDGRRTSTLASGPGAQLRLDRSGLKLQGLALHAPLQAVVAPLPHALARAGWHGDLALDLSAWHCTPSGSCTGELLLRWYGAGSRLLPGERFGDYELSLQARDAHLDYRVRTLSGRVELEGSGKAPHKGRPDFNGTLRGEHALLERLPAVSGGAVRRSSEPGRFELNWPPR